MLYSGTDPESYITEYTLVYEDNLTLAFRHPGGLAHHCQTSISGGLERGPTRGWKGQYLSVNLNSDCLGLFHLEESGT